MDNNTPTPPKLFHLIATPANPVNEVQINAKVYIENHLKEIEVALNKVPNAFEIQRKVEFFFRVACGEQGQLCFLSDPPIKRETEGKHIADVIGHIGCESYNTGSWSELSRHPRA